jgi:hypothetical protein
MVSRVIVAEEMATLPDAVTMILPPLDSFPLDGLVTFIAADACCMARNTLAVSWTSDNTCIKGQRAHDNALTRMIFMKVSAVVLSNGSLDAIPAWKRDIIAISQRTRSEEEMSYIGEEYVQFPFIFQGLFAHS